MRSAHRLSRLSLFHVSTAMLCLPCAPMTIFALDVSLPLAVETQHGKVANTEDKQTAPSIRYKEDKDGVQASLELSSYSLGRTLVFSIEHGSSKLPALEDQGRLLDTLLKRLLRDHTDIDSAYVMLGGNREALFPQLDDYLLRSPLWDRVHGRPVHGQLGKFLVDTINSQGIIEPLTHTFKANGFDFKLEGVGRIMIEKVGSKQDARLPTHIDVMSFQARKIIGRN